MTTYILATHNQHKTDEIRKMLAPYDIELQSLSDIGYHEEIIEDGDTMKANAKIKTDTIRSQGHTYIMSDDSGLEVDALDGAPGIYSARYAGTHGDHEANMSKLLQALDGESKRGAQFRTVLSVWAGDNHLYFEGIVRGTIALERMGKGGFGYDPIFIPEGYKESFGVLSADIKNQMSHRANAIKAFIQFLTSH